MAVERARANLINVSGLRVERDVVILDGIDWVVRTGEHWVILGPNGSGKSSLLAVICGYLTPTAGRVELLGEAYGESDWTAMKARVGLVGSVIANQIEPMETAAEVVLSGRFGMVNFWGRASKADRLAALEMLDQVEATDLARREWVKLSQGERQRVLIGRALMSGCGVLFLDEPCAGMDPVAREKFLAFVERLGSNSDDSGGLSLVLVTHHVEEITPCFGNALLLGAGGRVVASGESARVLRSGPLSEAFGARLRVRRTPGGRMSLRMSGM